MTDANSPGPSAADLAPLPTATVDGVFVVTLVADKPVVVLNLALIRRLEKTLRAAPRDARGLVLRSEGKVFVAGADLNEIQRTGDDELHKYLELGARTFQLLADAPYPTVAAIHGAALGGGLELAMHCDLLVGAPGEKPYPVGLPEAGLGLCPGWGGTNLLPARIDAADAVARTAEGRPMTFDEARGAGLFDVVAPSADELLDTAVKLAQDSKTPVRDGAPAVWIGRRPGDASKGLEEARGSLPATPAARAVARCVETGLNEGWGAALSCERRELVRLRHTPEAVEKLEAFFARSAGGKK